MASSNKELFTIEIGRFWYFKEIKDQLMLLYKLSDWINLVFPQKYTSIPSMAKHYSRPSMKKHTGKCGS